MIALRALLSALSPPGPRGRLSILLLHRVLPHPDLLFPGEMHAATFEQLLQFVKSRFNVLPLGEAVTRLQAGSLPARALAITFDDGYANNFTIALPLLRQYELPATVFVSTGYLDGRNMWNDVVIESIRNCTLPTLNLASIGLGSHALDSLASRQAAVADCIGRMKYWPQRKREDTATAISELSGATRSESLMMSPQQVRGLHGAGMSVGAHTITHPILASATPAEATIEIRTGKAELESIIGATVDLFAYPNGRPDIDYRREHVEMVKSAGFRAAVSTVWGAANARTDVYQLPRFTPWDQIGARFELRMAQNLLRPSVGVVT